MMYYVYVLKSLKTGKYYLGYSNNISRRLEEHNKGKSKSTKGRRPWELIYSEEYKTEKEAIIRERYLKSLKKRKSIENLIKTRGGAEVAR